MNEIIYDLDFAVFEDELLSGSKFQTLRRNKGNRYEALKNATLLNCYWRLGTHEQYLMFSARVTFLGFLSFRYPQNKTPVPVIHDGNREYSFELTPLLREDFAKADGFETYADLVAYLEAKYGDAPCLKEFIIIRFEKVE